MMGDIQQYFIANKVRNFYSVSISGYHIAEAGANPISQLALHPGQRLQLRGVLPEPGHAHRRLRAQPELFLQQRHGPGIHRDRPGGPAHLGRWPCGKNNGASARSQMLKYHTSRPRGDRFTARRSSSTTSAPPCRGCAPSTDNCNSLHTNAYDEAITTPTEESVPPGAGHPDDNQPGVGPGQKREPPAGGVHRGRTHRPGGGGGAERNFCVSRPGGGVLGAMETGYQRSKIQDESHLL